MPEPDADVEGTLEPSLDVTQRLGANLLASATVNTDFAETEVDTRQTNLTRFALFFPEKRTFFLEGSDIFAFGFGLGRDLLPYHSRRIGLVDGQPVPVRVGGKVSGRAGNTNVGFLSLRTGAVDDVAPAWCWLCRCWCKPKSTGKSLSPYRIPMETLLSVNPATSRMSRAEASCDLTEMSRSCAGHAMTGEPLCAKGILPM